MGRFILSIVAALAVAAPCGAWAAETTGTMTPAAQTTTTTAKPKTMRTRKPASTTTAAPAKKKTTGGYGTSTTPR